MTNPARLALLISLAAAACSSDPTSGLDPSLSSSSLLKNPGKGTKNKDAALRLDGVDDYADVASALAFDVDVLTVEAWVRLDQDIGPTQVRVVNRQASQSGIEGWGLQIFGAGYAGTSSTGNAVAFHSNNCTAAKNLETGYNLRKRRWYHLAAVNDGTTLRVYVDGRLVGSTSSLGPPCKPISAPIVVGRTGPGPDFVFPGRIDDVRIWRVARSPAEIAGNMNYELSGREPGLVVYWPFDEGTGTTAFDKTGHGHDATLQNGVSWTKHKMKGRSNNDDDDDDDDDD